jgi:hypothetical protein
MENISYICDRTDKPLMRHVVMMAMMMMMMMMRMMLMRMMLMMMRMTKMMRMMMRMMMMTQMMRMMMRMIMRLMRLTRKKMAGVALTIPMRKIVGGLKQMRAIWKKAHEPVVQETGSFLWAARATEKSAGEIQVVLGSRLGPRTGVVCPFCDHWIGQTSHGSATSHHAPVGSGVNLQCSAGEWSNWTVKIPTCVHIILHEYPHIDHQHTQRFGGGYVV